MLSLTDLCDELVCAFVTDDVVFCVVVENANFLGISIVGQSSKGGDGGIYVGSIMKG